MTSEVKTSSVNLVLSMVEQSKFDDSNLKREDLKLSSLRVATLKCGFKDWCRTVCVLPADDFIFSDMILVGGIIDSDPGDKIACYTKRQRGSYIPSTKISAIGSPTSGDYASRIVDNILDGIYTYRAPLCYLSSTQTENPFILVNLGQVEKIRKVVLISQPRGNMSDKFNDFQVRIGNSSSSGSFEDYVLIGSVGDAPELNTEFVIERTNPIYGQYVAIVKFEKPLFQICHMEIL